MKIIHLVPHINQEASGPSYSVPRLCQSLAHRGNEVELSCLAAQGTIDGVRLDVHEQWKIFQRFAVSPGLVRNLYGKAGNFEVVHNHSLWSMVNVAAGCVVPGRGAKLVASPRGTLSKWALSRNKAMKTLLWPLQRRVLTRADLIHVTSEVEYQEVRALGLTSPVMIIPNGIDLPEQTLSEDTLKESSRTLLFLSRIHPTKGIDRLLHAWATLQKRHPHWRLMIAGIGDVRYVEEVNAMASSLGLERVEFPGPLYGAAKKHAYFAADLFVLPTHSENFGIVVAEALAHSTPAVVSRGAPWSGLETEGCGWWIEQDVPTLTGALDCAMSMPASQLAEMGRKGRAWMERDFGWESIARRMESGYRWLIDGGAPPECVRLQ